MGGRWVIHLFLINSGMVGGVDVERKGHRLNIDDARLMTLIVTQKK
mgnify:CR=1 FL=1